MILGYTQEGRRTFLGMQIFGFTPLGKKVIFGLLIVLGLVLCYDLILLLGDK